MSSGPERDLPRPGRPDPAGDPDPSGRRRSVGDRIGGGVSDESARHLQAPEGAREGRARVARPGRPAPAVPARGDRVTRCDRVAGRLPGLLGRELPTPGHAALGAVAVTDAVDVRTPSDREIELSRTFAAP